MQEQPIHQDSRRFGWILLIALAAFTCPSVIVAQRVRMSLHTAGVTPTPASAACVPISTLRAQLSKGPAGGRASAAWALSLEAGEGACPDLLRALRASGDAHASTQQIILALGATGSRLALPYLKHIIRDTRFGRTVIGVSGRPISLSSRQAALLSLAARRLYLWDSTLTECILDRNAPHTLKSSAAASLCWQLVRDSDLARRHYEVSPLGAVLGPNPISAETALALHDALEFFSSDLRRWVKLALHLTNPSSSEPPSDVIALQARLRLLKVRGVQEPTPLERLAALQTYVIPTPLRFTSTSTAVTQLARIHMANQALAPSTIMFEASNFLGRFSDYIKIFGLMVDFEGN